MNYRFDEELINDKLSFNRWMRFIIIGGIIGLVTYLDFIENQTVEIIIYMISTFLILLGIVSYFDKIIIRIRRNDLIIEKVILGKKIIKNYDIMKMKNVSYRKHVKSNHYTSSGHAEMGGMDVTPESWKKYYYHNEIVSFEFDTKRIEIGKWKKVFEGKKLFDIIKRIRELNTTANYN